ncbi:MAG: serine/threonine-protein kinase [Bdellovibrionota bacterium]
MPKENRYILVEKLARGGMAEIYLGRLATEDGFKRVCCIKRILPHYSHEKEYIEMFRDEAHICKRLQHANIVRVEGFEEVDGSYAIIMEYVDGADLRKILAACENAGIAIPIPMALYITAEIARGLHYAHTKIDDITRKPLSIVHRDISPQNILVSFEGEAKVTDFGIADAENKSTETKPGIVKGKYSYMSPEQIMAKNVDARTDVFALAIVLWEMIAMERLFLFENDVITIQKVKNCEIKRLPRGVKRPKSEIDDELEAIILSGLQKDLKKRYPDAKAFEGALRKYLSKRYPSFVPTELSVFFKKPVVRRKKNHLPP